MNQATEELEPSPVFVDPTGRRARIMRRAGIALGCLVAAYLALITVGLATGARVPLTPWPQTKHSKSGRGPAEDGLMPRSGARNPLPGQSSAAGVPPSGPAPTTATSHAPTGGTRSAAPGATTTAAPGSPTPTTGTTTPPVPTTAPGKGHGYGRTKRPHPGTS